MSRQNENIESTSRPFTWRTITAELQQAKSVLFWVEDGVLGTRYTLIELYVSETLYWAYYMLYKAYE